MILFESRSFNSIISHYIVVFDTGTMLERLLVAWDSAMILSELLFPN